MKKITVSNEKIADYNDAEPKEFPKYTTQLINTANQNAQATRAKVVGQLSDLFPQYLKEVENPSIESWEKWYFSKYPNSIDNATNKIIGQVNNFKKALPKVDEEMIRNWVYDLLITKTYNGLYLQEAILVAISKEEGKPYRTSTPREESIGIDGYIGEVPVSIKPHTYDYMSKLSEQIDVKMIKYRKTKATLHIEYDL